MKFNMKNAALIIFFVISLMGNNYVFSDVSQNKKNFIRGNIADKTSAVLKASGADKPELSLAAIDFAVTYKSVLGDDKDLSALAVAGILSLPSDYVEKADSEEKAKISEYFMEIYNLYTDDTVKIAVLDRLSKLNISNAELSAMLNDYIKSSAALSKTALTKSVITTLGAIGNKESFNILLGCSFSPDWKNFTDELNNALTLLAEKSLPELIAKIQSGNIQECRKIFDLTVKNDKNSQIYKAEIAENILSRAIYIAENSNSVDKTLVDLQLDSFNVLVERKWTRGANTAMTFFEIAKKEYATKILDGEGFISVVKGMADVAPIQSAAVLSAYLQKLSQDMEKAKNVSTEPVVLAIINTLGAIGDKSAFDPLLAVINNYNYSENVVAAARNALAKLKW